MVWRTRWWLEKELAILTVLVGAIYFPRLADLNLRGEEPRRGQVAREMMLSGDWVVPREQGKPFLSRPPLQNWVIAAVAKARGRLDSVAIRLPSAIAILLTTWLIYGYCRTFLSRWGSLAGAIAYPTMGQVLQLGWTGETEALYTLVVRDRKSVV
jgi:4-amino-4-deoxy-L-arabinose transferase-like glycosyltransferase